MRRLFAFLSALGCLLATPAGASISTSASSESATAGAGWTHTETGLPEGLIVFCMAPNGAADYFSGATYDGNALTFLFSAVDDTGEPVYIEAYSKESAIGSGGRTVVCQEQNSPTSSYGVAITLNTSSNRNVIDAGTACAFSGDSANPSCTISGLSGNAFVVTGLMSGHDAIGSAVGAAPTTALVQSNDFGTVTGQVYSTGSDAAATAGAWTATSEDVAMVAVAMQELPAVETPRFTDIGHLGTSTNCAAGTTCAASAAAAAEVGNLVICSASKDETGTGTTDGDNAQFTSIADSDGNTWTELGETCNMQDATAATGQCAAIFMSRVTNEIEAADTITVTFSATTARSAVTCHEFGAKTTPIVVSCPATPLPRALHDDASDPNQTSCALPADLGAFLFYRATASETNAVTYEPSSNWVEGTQGVSNSGVVATSSSINVEYSIGLGKWPGYPDGNVNTNPFYTSVDHASLLLILRDALSQARSISNQ